MQGNGWHRRTLLPIAAAVLVLLVWWSSATVTTAFDTCGGVSGQWVCGARWYTHQLWWHDSTGWTGSKQSAVLSAGPKWSAVADTFTAYYDSSPYGPYQAYAYLYDLDSLSYYVPGATWTYGATGDVYNIVGAETALNSTWSWNTSGTMSLGFKVADVLTITLHEMGHWMLLGHPCGSQPSAVMCPQNSAKWNLSSDDQAGIQALYY